MDGVCRVCRVCRGSRVRQIDRRTEDDWCERPQRAAPRLRGMEAENAPAAVVVPAEEAEADPTAAGMQVSRMFRSRVE